MKNKKSIIADIAVSAGAASAIDRGILEDLLGYHLRKAQSTVFDDFMRAMTEERITPGQFGVLTLIAANQGLNQSTLAQALGIERSTMVAVITGLEKRGLIKRIQVLTDRRANMLTLTPEGRTLLDKVNEKVRAHEANITSGLNKEEIETLLALLKKLSNRR